MKKKDRTKKLNREVNLVLLRKKINAKGHGCEAGAENEPSTNATEPCHVERQIEQDISSALMSTVTPKCNEIEKLHQRNNENYMEMAPEIFKYFREQATSERLKTQFSSKNKIKQAEMTNDRNKRRLKAQTNQGIHASSSDVGRHLLVYAVLLTFLVLESFINAFLIGHVVQGGIQEGLVKAFLIAALSIAISLAVGTLIRKVKELSWTGWLKNGLMIIVSVLFLGLISTYHFIIGWYRACLLNPDLVNTAEHEAINQFLIYGFQLPDIYTWGLTIVGLLFASTAVVAGYQLIDAIRAEKQARIVKAYESSEANLRSVEQQYLAEIHEIYRDKQTEVNLKLEAFQAIGREYGKNTRIIKELTDIVKFKYDIFKQFYTSEIISFRDNNIRVRTSKAPEYMVKDPVFSIRLDTLLNDPMYTPDKDNLKIAAKLKEIREMAIKVKSGLQEDHEAALTEAPFFIEAAKLRTKKTNDKEAKTLHLAKPGLAVNHCG